MHAKISCFTLLDIVIYVFIFNYIDEKYIDDKRSKEKIKKIPGERGGEQYTQWIGEILADISVIEESSAHQFYITSRKYLDVI